MPRILEAANKIVWGAPALILILGVGLFLTLRTGFVQITLFPRGAARFLKMLRRENRGGGVSSFRALCTALGATVGTGNLIGVAGAIALGGPGAIFWMWLCGLLGMATKYAEATLAVRYRREVSGERLGGPMYMIAQGLGPKWTWLGSLYSFFGIVAAFGVGNATQINAVIAGINQVTGRESPGGNLLMGIILAVLVGMMLLGGAERIGRAAEFLVPFACAGYLILCAGVLILRFQAIPDAFRAIVTGAFSPEAVTGGAVGSAFQALRVGVSRGVFTNEAGMGTAAIAHGSADVAHPAEQGLMGIMEVFLDTILMCTLTALVILCSGVPIPYGGGGEGALTAAAFSSVYGSWASVFLAAALCCFAFATVLGWGFYGFRCVRYLFGGNGRIFALLQTLTVVLGAVLGTGVVWSLAETVNGLMAIPNLIALVFLSPELKRLTDDYKK